MKIRRVTPNNHKKAFEVFTWNREYRYPFFMASPAPSPENRIREVWVDRELGCEGFTYTLESGDEGTVHIDHVLEYNKDPGYMADLLLYRLTVEAQNRIEKTPLSRREIIRRLGTSAAQFYRLLDPTNCRKSVRQMLSLLYVLDCEVELVVKERRSA